MKLHTTYYRWRGRSARGVSQPYHSGEMMRRFRGEDTEIARRAPSKWAPSGHLVGTWWAPGGHPRTRSWSGACGSVLRGDRGEMGLGGTCADSASWGVARADRQTDRYREKHGLSRGRRLDCTLGKAAACRRSRRP